VSIVVAFECCPFTGPSTGDAFLLMLGFVLASHLFASVISLFLGKFRWISALLIGLICLLPAGFFAGFAIEDHIYVRHYAVYDRFRDNLANPVPKSVTNLRFNTLKEAINPDASFRFNIAPADLEEIIRQRGLKLVQPDALKCPADYFKFPYYLPLRGPFNLYQGTDSADNVLTLKVNEARDQVVFRLESAAYYKYHYWESNPDLVKMGQDELARLKKEWESQEGRHPNDSRSIGPETNRKPPAAEPADMR
jgi:hypothetical protein